MRMPAINLWLVFFALVAGLLRFCELSVPFWLVLVVSLCAFWSTGLWIIRRFGDYFHPLLIFSLSFLTRLWLPAFLIFIGVHPPVFLGHDWTRGEAWQRALALGIVAHLILILGWALAPKWPALKTKFLMQQGTYSERYELKALLAMSRLWFTIGLGFYLFFFVINFGIAGSINVILNGVLRGGSLQQPGTSRYIYLAGNFMRWSALLIVIIQFLLGRGLLRSFTPLLVLVVLSIPFGGRVVAFMPLLMGLMAVWYSGWRLAQSRKILLISTGILFLFIYMAPAIRAYRGGGIHKFINYLRPYKVLKDNILFWGETNMLHAYTYGVILGPGSYAVSPLRYLFGGYTAYFLGISGEMAHGGFVVKKITGVPQGWGIHTGLPVDYYMSFGLVPMIVAMFVLGGLLRFIYKMLLFHRKNTSSVVRNAAYVFLFWDFYWLVYERGLGVLSLYESLVFLVVIVWTAKLIKRRTMRKRFPESLSFASRLSIRGRY